MSEKTRLEKLFAEDYLPLMASTLILAHLDSASTVIVREVLVNAAKSADELPTKGEMLQNAVSQITFRIKQHGYTTQNAETIRATHNIGSLPPGRRYPMEMHEPDTLSERERRQFLMPSKGMSKSSGGAEVFPTREKWILYPLMQDEPDAYKKQVKAKLLQWFSHLVNSAKIIAILGVWLGYDPKNADAEDVLREIAAMMGQEYERAEKLWQTQQEVWQEIFGEDDTTLYEAIGLWLEAIPISKEELYEECLGHLG